MFGSEQHDDLYSRGNCSAYNRRGYRPNHKIEEPPFNPLATDHVPHEFRYQDEDQPNGQSTEVPDRPLPLTAGHES